MCDLGRESIRLNRLLLLPVSSKLKPKPMKTNIQMIRNPYMDKVKEDREANYSKSVYKNLPLLAVASLVALPIAFFILMWVTNELVEITSIINNL
jgi:hypothetical protein